jgi:hypothetical protein
MKHTKKKAATTLQSHVLQAVDELDLLNKPLDSSSEEEDELDDDKSSGSNTSKIDVASPAPQTASPAPQTASPPPTIPSKRKRKPKKGEYVSHSAPSESLTLFDSGRVRT